MRNVICSGLFAAVAVAAFGAADEPWFGLSPSPRTLVRGPGTRQNPKAPTSSEAHPLRFAVCTPLRGGAE